MNPDKEFEDPMNWSDQDLEKLAAEAAALLVTDSVILDEDLRDGLEMVRQPGGIDAATWGR